MIDFFNHELFFVMINSFNDIKYFVLIQLTGGVSRNKTSIINLLYRVFTIG